MSCSPIRVVLRASILILLLWLNTGCIKDHAVFVTSTTFGLDVSQQADQPPKIHIGYKRQEGVSLPAEHENAQEKESDVSPATGDKSAPKDTPNPAKNDQGKTKDKSNDTYSVLGYFCVMANPSLWDAIKALAPFSDDVPDALQISSVFATGLTAQQLGQDPTMREFFQKQLTKSKLKGSEKRCN